MPTLGTQPILRNYLYLPPKVFKTYLVRESVAEGRREGIALPLGAALSGYRVEKSWISCLNLQLSSAQRPENVLLSGGVRERRICFPLSSPTDCEQKFRLTICTCADAARRKVGELNAFINSCPCDTLIYEA